MSVCAGKSSRGDLLYFAPGKNSTVYALGKDRQGNDDGLLEKHCESLPPVNV